MAAAPAHAPNTIGEARHETEQRVSSHAAALSSLGCGNPTAVAELDEGETVLDSAAASTCSCLRVGSVRAARCTGST